MLHLTFDQAWSANLAAASRLPPIPTPTTPRRVTGVLEAASAHDLVVLDAYGVLHTGGEPFPQALAAVAALHRADKAVAVVTNDVTRPPAEVAARLRQRGFRIADDAVISGRDLLADALAPVDGGQGFGVIATDPGPLLARFPGLNPLPDDAAAYDAVGGFVLVDTNAWGPRHPEFLIESQRRRPRPMVVCNPDVTCPYLGTLSAEPGYFAHAIAEETGAEPMFLGKPFPAIFERVVERFSDIPRDRMLMVGDTPQTDVIGARNAGLTTLLVESGLLAGQDTDKRLGECGIWPDYVSATI